MVFIRVTAATLVVEHITEMSTGKQINSRWLIYREYRILSELIE